MADALETPVAPAADPAAPAATPDPAPAPSGESLPPALTADPAEKPAADPAKPPEGEKPPEAKPTDAVVPEKYEFTTPEGMQVDAAFTDAMSPAFKEAGITQNQLNVIMKAYNEYGQKFTAENEKKAEADFTNWMAEQARENDKAIRKEWGADYDANFKVAQRGLARFFRDGEFYRVLDETGLVRHPSFMKGLLQIGRMIQEDTPPNGAQQGGRKSDAELFYGTSSH